MLTKQLAVQEREFAQINGLFLGKGTPLDIGNTQRAEWETRTEADWMTSVKPQARRLSDEWILGESVIVLRVIDDKEIIVRNSAITECDAARRFTTVEADFGFELLPVSIDETDRADRNIKVPGIELSQSIEGRTAAGVKNSEISQSGKPLRFSRKCWSAHTSSSPSPHIHNDELQLQNQLK